ncbi:MAG TPA: sigma-54 dependent transcriptional regulator [Candidatus Methylomirabilis sp.]|nr:sigma-54 dependent transcriptional regulator [Candidatus Methylomirabilis sp.]
MSTILIVDDEKSLRRFLRDTLEGEGHAVHQAATGEEALDRFAQASFDLVLLDMILPDLNGLQVLRRIKRQAPDVPVIIMTAYSEVRGAVEAMKAQAADYLCKPFDLEELKLVVQRILEATALAQKYRRLQELEEGRHQTAQITGESRAARRLRQVIKQVAVSEAQSVLIHGESGTGKELVARGLHYNGPRREYPLVEVNCAGISETLFESELFGHERGAFTDAKTGKKGLVEVAHKGTLFLDEIGEMSLPLQAKFLRFLEERRFRRVGGTHDIPVDVRVVSATNRDLLALVQEGAFRKDLYYRLNLIFIPLPPLRERLEDIQPLARHFLEQANQMFKKSIHGFTPEADQLLKAYAWPGNVRELRNVVERIVILESDDMIGPQHLPPEISGERLALSAGTFDVGALFPKSLPEVERAYIEAVLKRIGGNKTKAAEILGITRQTLRAKVAPPR